jgi:uncharacterized protein YggE
MKHIHQGNANIVVGFGVLSVMLIAAAFILPWKNINWGKVEMSSSQVVTVIGEAKTQQKNQIATFNAGVNVFSDKKETAISEVNTKINELVDAIKKFGIPEDDIKTQNMSVYQQQDPNLTKSKNGQWIVNNSIEITLRDLDKANALTDLLNRSGANNVYGPNFRIDDTNTVSKTLYNDAMKDAREKAEIIAKSSGRTLGKVIGVSEGAGSTNGIYPLYKDGMGGAGAEIGSQTVAQHLTVTFELN